MSAQDGIAPQNRPVTAAEFAAAVAPFNLSGNIAIGFSGGPDSLALLILAARWAKRRKGVSLHALTVDHGLRAASAAEARRAASLAKDLGVPHRILRWKGEKPASGIQAAAREARYGLLRDACRKLGASDLLIAHHLDDQAETFLLRLARGSGVDGLAAMAPERPLLDGEPHIRLVRPLLDLPRTRLLATVRRSALVAIEDPSNEDERFDRVRARKVLSLLAQLGLDAARLARTAGQMGRVRDALRAETMAFLSAHAVRSVYGHVEVDADALAAMPAEISLRVLASLVRVVGGNDYPPRLDALEGVRDALRDGALGHGRTLAGVKFAMVADRLVAMRELAAASKAEPLALKAGEEGLWDGRFAVAVSKAPRGSRFSVKPLGQAGVSLLRSQGIAMPAVPKPVLFSLPGLWRNDALTAAPHLGTLDPRIASRASLRRRAGLWPSNAPEIPERKANEPGAGTW